MSEIALVRGWTPGLLGWIVAEHGTYYEREWKLGCVFEAKVAEGLGALAGRTGAPRDLLLSARSEDAVLGAIAVDGSAPTSGGDGARIRYFILADAARGRGVGRRLLGETMAFIGACGYRHAWLTTFAGLDAARHLYESMGFSLTHEVLDTTWGTSLREQRFDWTAPAA